MKPPHKIIIAIDGPSSSGKSTFAKAIARELGYLYIDSGAMYRAVTLFAMENKLINHDEPDVPALISALDQITIEFRQKAGADRQETFLNGTNVENEIRSIEVSAFVSPVSKIREVRLKMVELQRVLGKDKGIVMDGRDIGTVVFPEAEMKIFLTCGLEARAQRRFKELKEKGMEVSYKEVLHNISERDRIDQAREESPLRQAPDAVLLDNSVMTPEEQMDWFRAWLKKKYQ